MGTSRVRYRIGLVLLVVVFAVSICLTADDTQRAAKVTSLSGTTRIMKSGGEKSIKAFKGMGLLKKDTIATTEAAGINLEMDKDKTVKIDENTIIKIMELSNEISAQSGKTAFNLMNGKIFVKIDKKLAKDSKFEIVTPTAIMGVRGTLFYVIQEGSRTEIGVFEGVVNVTTFYSYADQLGNVMRQSITFDLLRNQRVILDENIEKPQDIVIQDLTQAGLDSFVLKAIKECPTRVESRFLVNIDKVIEEKAKAENAEETNAQRLVNADQQILPMIIYNHTLPSEEPPEKDKDPVRPYIPGTYTPK